MSLCIDLDNIDRTNRSKRDMYEKIFNFLPEGICVYENQTCIFVNNSLNEMLSYNSDENNFDFTRELLLKNNIGIYDNLLKRLKLKNMKGEDVFLEVSDKKIYDDGKEVTVRIFTDVTEKIRLEEIKLKFVEEELLLNKTLEFDKIKTEFLSNISHDLRTPLNILVSSLQLINIYVEDVNSINKVSIKKYLGIMKQNCYRLLRLINNLLDITKIEAGFFTIQCRNQNIVSIVEEITLSVVEYLKCKNVDIIFDTDVEEKIVFCDENKIERIMLNLLSNAIKFTAPGGKIEVSLYDEGNKIKISIKDNGIGIPEEKLATIFDRFVQVESYLIKKKDGSGIGLALVKNFVEMQKGEIEVKSKFGEGTEFLITFPADPENAFYQIDMDICKEFENNKEKNIEKMHIEFSDIYSSF